MRKANSAFPLSPMGNSETRTAKDYVKVHTVDTNARIILDAKINMLLNAKSEVPSGRKILFPQLILFNLKCQKPSFHQHVSLNHLSWMSVPIILCMTASGRLWHFSRMENNYQTFNIIERSLLSIATYLKSFLQNLFCFRSSDSTMNSNLFVSSNSKRSNSVASLIKD